MKSPSANVSPHPLQREPRSFLPQLRDATPSVLFSLTGMRHVWAQALGFPASAACKDKQEMEEEEEVGR